MSELSWLGVDSERDLSGVWGPGNKVGVFGEGMAQQKQLTAIEIAARLGITAKAFRRWLRDQATAGNPLVAHHSNGDLWLFDQS